MLRLHTYHPFEALASLCTLESMPTKSTFVANIANDNAIKGTTYKQAGEHADKEASKYVGGKIPLYYWKASNR